MTKHRLFSRLFSLAAAFFVFATFFSSGAFAADRGETVLVGAAPNFGIYKIGSDYNGVGYDFLSAISRFTGHKYSFVEGTEEELVQMLLDKKIDIIPCVSESEWEIYRNISDEADNSGASLTDFSMLAKFSAVYTYDFSRKNEICYDDIESLNKARIGYLAEDESKFFKDGKFVCGEISGAEFILYNTEDQLRSDLRASRIDAVVKESLRVWDNEKIVYRFGMEESYFLVSSGDKELAAQINDAMYNIYTLDPQYPAAVYDRNLAMYGAQKYAFSKEELAYIEAHPEITVAYNENADLIEFYDTGYDMISGLTGSVIEMVEDYSGLKLNVVTCETLADCVKMLESGEADVICGNANAASMANFGNYYTTLPYNRSPIVTAGHSDTVLGDRMKLAVPENSADIVKYMKKLYPAASFLPYDNVELCMEAVRRGEADAVCAGAHEIIYLKNGGYDDMDILNVCAGFHTDSMVTHHNTPLCAILEKSLLQISYNSATVTAYNNMTAMGYESMSLNRFVDKYSWLILSIFIIVLLCIILLILLAVVRNNRAAETDPLTGGRSKGKYIDDTRKMLKKSIPEKWAVVLFDIDKFKYVNDSLGYQEGNRMLERLYKTLGDHLDDDEIFARISDDNFACTVHNATDNELITKIHRVFNEFERRNALFVKYPVLFSAGVCRFEECIDKNGGIDINAALDRCTIAKKTLKGLHESSIAFYDGKIRDRALREKDYESVMPAALKNHEFQCYLQPKYGTKSKHIEGAEALIRWNSSEYGFIYPDSFIPLSEKNGFVVELDFFILEEVCKAMKRWISQGRTPVVVSVNQSRLHINYDDYIWRLREIVDKYEIPYEYIELELTESVFSDNTELMLKIMNKLHEIGFKLSIDDFGSGYSSLNILKDIPADVVKIDREFFNGTVNSAKGRAVISTVVDLAKNLNMEVISEGVETGEQVEFLKQIDCAMVQGYYFAKPMPMNAFEELWVNDLALKDIEQQVGE